MFDDNSVFNHKSPPEVQLDLLWSALKKFTSDASFPKPMLSAIPTFSDLQAYINNFKSNKFSVCADMTIFENLVKSYFHFFMIEFEKLHGLMLDYYLDDVSKLNSWNIIYVLPENRDKVKLKLVNMGCTFGKKFDSDSSGSFNPDDVENYIKGDHASGNVSGGLPLCNVDSYIVLIALIVAVIIMIVVYFVYNQSSRNHIRPYNRFYRDL